MSLTSWTGTYDPFYEMKRLQRDMDRMMSSFNMGMTPVTQGTQMWNPICDIKTNDKEITVHAELPGVKKEDINIELKNGMLTISGQKKEEKREQTDKYQRSERFFGSFTRSFSVPETITDKDIKAKFDNGVLEVTCPSFGKGETGAKRITIA